MPLYLATPVGLRPGQSAQSPAEQISVTFTSVVEDSRCPRGARCVWEGNAGVALLLAAPGGSAAVVLNTSGRFDREASRFGLTLRLLDLSPLPGADAPVASGEYTATISVTRP